MRSAPLTVLAVVLVAIAACSGEPAASPTTTEPPLPITSMSESWGCGYGFRLSDPDQTIGLIIEFVDWEAAAAGGFPDVTELPDDQWSARLVTGTDLFANWCDDVVEPGEPEPVVTAEYPVVAGRLVIEQVPGPQAGGTARLAASGLMAERTDGTEIEIGDLVIVNQSWGFFAG